MLEPVFKPEIENIDRDRGKVFAEFKTRNIMTFLIADILGNRTYTAICLHHKNKQQPTRDRIFRHSLFCLFVNFVSSIYV